MTTLGLDVDRGTRAQIIKIEKLGRDRHCDSHYNRCRWRGGGCTGIHDRLPEPSTIWRTRSSSLRSRRSRETIETTYTTTISHAAAKPPNTNWNWRGSKGVSVLIRV